jgi:trans-aconitate 2-methyltransferase
MPWDPSTYNQFKKERYQPFFELVSHISHQLGMKMIDLGCGTGELTAILAEKFSDATVVGIDNSAEMLAQAPTANNLSFRIRSIEAQIADTEKFDVIVANASLQWIDDHPVLFPQLLSKLNTGGQIAVQMPSQTENRLNKILTELVQESPFKEALNGFVRWSPVLSLEEYSQILFDHHTRDMIVYQKVYPVIAASHDALFDFISGSALIPYMEKLDKPAQIQLELAFKKRIAAEFKRLPALYAFKRIILYASL